MPLSWSRFTALNSLHHHLPITYLTNPTPQPQPPETEILFIESRELAAHLRRRFQMAPRRAGYFDPHRILEVPVFVFNLDR
jgi:hypothetical protein